MIPVVPILSNAPVEFQHGYNSNYKCYLLVLYGIYNILYNSMHVYMYTSNVFQHILVVR